MKFNWIKTFEWQPPHFPNQKKTQAVFAFNSRNFRTNSTVRLYLTVTTLHVKQTENTEVLSISSLSRKSFPLANLSWGTPCCYEMLSYKKKNHPKQPNKNKTNKTPNLCSCSEDTDFKVGLKNNQNAQDRIEKFDLIKNRVTWLYKFYMAKSGM